MTKAKDALQEVYRRPIEGENGLTIGLFFLKQLVENGLPLSESLVEFTQNSFPKVRKEQLSAYNDMVMINNPDEKRRASFAISSLLFGLFRR